MRFQLLLKNIIIFFVIPVCVCSVSLILFNYFKPMYRADAMIISNQQLIPTIPKGSLKGLSRSIKILIKTKHRQKGQNSALELNKKLALLESRALKESFIQAYNLKPILYPKLWDKINGTWKSKVIDNKEDYSNDRFSTNQITLEPSQWKAVKKFSKGLSIKHDKNEGFIRLSFMWHDAVIAAEVVNQYIEYANKFIADHENQRLSERAVSIEEVLNAQKISIMRTMLLDELDSINFSLAMDNVETKPAFKVIAPALLPEASEFRFSKFLFFIVLLACWLVIGVLRLKNVF